jgi:DNA-binding protein HU-beta
MTARFLCARILPQTASVCRSQLSSSHLPRSHGFVLPDHLHSSVSSGTYSVHASRSMKTRADLGKQDLVDIVSQNCHLTKQQSKIAVDCLFDSIIAAVSSGDKVSVPGFGAFERTIRSARQGRNPSTGESLWIEESASIAFKPGSTFKSTVKDRYKEKQ